ncbi:MAG TPA: RibD family protein [Chthonomonadaceae bacterium]|nr:RibD family protein [Chthonomonadaceae bacterium]
MPIERLLDLTGVDADPDDLYRAMTFSEPPDERPYVVINMVSTVDGKIVIGEPSGPAKGVGGPTDQLLFRRLQASADGALIGSGTLRASQVLYPPTMPRFVATRSGKLPLDNRFFTDAPANAHVVAPEGLPEATRARLQSAARLIESGRGGVDWPAALRTIRRDVGVRVLLCEGGSEMNWQLVGAGLVDELFLTLAPKLKGGARLPTILGGAGFPPGAVQGLTLLSLYRDGSELYARYSVGRSQVSAGAATG